MRSEPTSRNHWEGSLGVNLTGGFLRGPDHKKILFSCLRGGNPHPNVAVDEEPAGNHTGGEARRLVFHSSWPEPFWFRFCFCFWFVFFRLLGGLFTAGAGRPTHSRATLANCFALQRTCKHSDPSCRGYECGCYERRCHGCRSRGRGAGCFSRSQGCPVPRCCYPSATHLPCWFRDDRRDGGSQGGREAHQ